MQTIDFSKLPNFGKLFLDYISEDEAARKKIDKYFSTGYRTNEDFFKVIDEKLHNYNSSRYFDKNVLIDILKRQNVSFNGNEKSAMNIDLLRKDDTFAVVTGQQVGLYTGNFYTILKTISTIKLAEDIGNRFPQFHFIPVFWLEADDHDFDESNHVNLINKNNELVRVGFEPQVEEKDETESAEAGEYVKRSTIPVGSMKFEALISEINDWLKEALIDTDFKQTLLEKINTYYSAGKDYKTSFALLMNWIFKEHGIVFIDPSDEEIKKLLTPIFEKELNTFPNVCEKVIHTSDELEHEYDLQVKPKVINLFFRHNENRYLIEPRENDMFALRNSKKRFEKEELYKILNEEPERFSANVVLRPICQDYLLPTVAYVGGPSEISYFAQFKNVYQHYDITMPVIYPRASVTILESKIKKFLENFDIKFEEVFDKKKIINTVVNKLSEIKIDDEFSKYVDDFNRIFYEMKNTTAKVDKTLLNSIDNIKDKFYSNLDNFRNKLINAQANKNETTTKQIDKVTNNLFPENNLQERVINVTYFLNKYGDAFLKKLFDEIDINKFAHQVIEM